MSRNFKSGIEIVSGRTYLLKCLSTLFMYTCLRAARKQAAQEEQEGEAKASVDLVGLNFISL